MARLVSRSLGGAAIYLLTLALLQLVFHRTPGATPLWAQLLLALLVAFVFMNSPRFRFMASFARVRSCGFQGPGRPRTAAGMWTTRGSSATSVQRGGELRAVLGDQGVVVAENREELQHGRPG